MDGILVVLFIVATVVLVAALVVRQQRKKVEDVVRVVEREGAVGGDGALAPAGSHGEDDALEIRPEWLPTVSVVWGTGGGTAERYGLEVLRRAKGTAWEGQVAGKDMESYEAGEELENEEIVVILLSTAAEGRPPPSAEGFCAWAKDEAFNPRAGNLLRSLSFCVLALGNSLYPPETFCRPGKDVNKWIGRLGASRLLPLAVLDENEDPDRAFEQWLALFWAALDRHLKAAAAASRGQGVALKGGDEEDEDDVDPHGAEPLLDIEDMGVAAASGAAAVTTTTGRKKGRRKGQNDGKKKKKKQSQGEQQETETETEEETEEEEEEEEEMDDDEEEELVLAGKMAPKEMLSSAHKRTLGKQGYKIIGSHSAVKMCRWTKAHMRGKGGCYKHTFYGIQSYGCMEMTPSMACANKCVFCWRHHKNPVGRDWRWLTDNAEVVVEEAVTKHQQMVRQLRGAKGVIPERFEDAFTVKHCALSLVGEPIVYPEINQLLQLLHHRDISTFLVTNAQFPERIESLVPVTQLYVSIDAATPERLKEIDRPLFHDFWQRFLDSIDALATKGQRTVFRLTLVKDHNMEEVRQYARLVLQGRPDFIEVKGVTYAGGGKRNPLTIRNCPWHEEVVDFCLQLAELVQEEQEAMRDRIAAQGRAPTPAEAEALAQRFLVASEHEHSCCVLVADANRFLRDGVWHTWIDFPRFAALSRRLERGEIPPFSSLDYVAPTPPWAHFGHRAQGFDPSESRVRRKGSALRRDAAKSRDLSPSTVADAAALRRRQHPFAGPLPPPDSDDDDDVDADGAAAFPMDDEDLCGSGSGACGSGACGSGDGCGSGACGSGACGSGDGCGSGACGDGNVGSCQCQSSTGTDVDANTCCHGTSSNDGDGSCACSVTTEVEDDDDDFESYVGGGC